MKICLNLGCGKNYRQSTKGEQWVNIDADPQFGADAVATVEYPPLHLAGRCDTVLAIDVLEHIPYREDDKDRWKDVLARWCACLKPGGDIEIQVPNLRAIVQRWNESLIDEETALRVIYGESTTLLDRHYQCFTDCRLGKALHDLGLVVVESGIRHVNLYMKARKPA